MITATPPASNVIDVPAPYGSKNTIIDHLLPIYILFRDISLCFTNSDTSFVSATTLTCVFERVLMNDVTNMKWSRNGIEIDASNATFTVRKTNNM